MARSRTRVRLPAPPQNLNDIAEGVGRRTRVVCVGPPEHRTIRWSRPRPPRVSWLRRASSGATPLRGADQAVVLLQDLREICDTTGRSSRFTRFVEDLRFRSLRRG